MKLADICNKLGPMHETSSGVYRPNVNAHANAQSLSPALHVRRFALRPAGRDASRAAVLLVAGTGAVGSQGKSVELAAPCLAWLPIGADDYLRLGAGSSGELLTLSDMLVKDAVGQGAESAHLRLISERAVVINAGDPAAIAEAASSFRAVAREVRRDDRGSWSYLMAHVALILVQCWRMSGFEDVARQDSDSHSALLVRYRHLVETHFRERWRIADYARELGVAHDRLHDVCVRVLQRTPKDLLHDRVGHEASLRLARSGLSIEALAEYLGFRSASHFSRFFKLRSGFTPAAYRKAARDATAPNRPLVATAYADWP